MVGSAQNSTAALAEPADNSVVRNLAADNSAVRNLAADYMAFDYIAAGFAAEKTVETFVASVEHSDC